MLILSYLYLYISWTLTTNPPFAYGLCRLQGNFRLNGMHQNGDLILGGLFEVHFLTIFPELNFTSRPEEPSCEQWVFDDSRRHYNQTIVMFVFYCKCLVQCCCLCKNKQEQHDILFMFPKRCILLMETLLYINNTCSQNVFP